MTEIVDLMIKRTADQLEGQGIGLELTVDAKHFLAERGYDPTMGARPLRRAIQRMIEDKLSEKLLYKEFRAGQIIVVDTTTGDSGETELVFTAHEGFQPPSTPELAEAGE